MIQKTILGLWYKCSDSSTLSWRKFLSIETSPLNCRANQWTGFYMTGSFVMKELKAAVWKCWKFSIPELFTDVWFSLSYSQNLTFCRLCSLWRGINNLFLRKKFCWMQLSFRNKENLKSRTINFEIHFFSYSKKFSLNGMKCYLIISYFASSYF